MNLFHRILHKGQLHKKQGHNRRASIYQRMMRMLYQCDISLEADIDDDVWFCHKGFGVVINSGASICGGGCIQHGVTIGELSEINKAPHIGHNVFIGAKASVLGDIQIGDNVKIGAGAVVLTDIPEGCTVVGIPARIVRNKQSKEMN